jgi:transposase
MITSGGDDMVKDDLWHEIHSRYKLKETKKSIARSLGVDVRTVRRILRQKEPQAYKRDQSKTTIVAPFQDYIRRRLAAVGYCAQSVFEELQGMGYRGGYDAVRRFVQPLRKEAMTEATVRFETPPGRQGQVDWGQCWTVLAGKRTKIHPFVMTLGYSRRMFAKGAMDEKIHTFIQCHVEAFDHFGGLPHEILYDNPKTVVLNRDFEGRQIQWNATFWDFCRYYGFRACAHKPYRPQTKGKVEAGIKYVKRYLRGKSFESLDHLNTVLLSWIANSADQRTHGTTHRKPADMFAEEQDLLISHQGKPPYTIEDRATRHVSRDCMIAFETNRYSVPARFVGKPVEVQGEGDLIRIFHGGSLIVIHPRCEGRYQNRINRDHYQGVFHRHQPVSCCSYHSYQDAENVQIRDLAFYEAFAQGGAR